MARLIIHAVEELVDMNAWSLDELRDEDFFRVTHEFEVGARSLDQLGTTVARFAVTITLRDWNGATVSDIARLVDELTSKPICQEELTVELFRHLKAESVKLEGTRGQVKTTSIARRPGF